MTLTKPLFRAAFCLACGVALPAHADGQPAAAGPAAALAVPATGYQTMLPYRPAPAPDTRPDQNWKALNRTVAGYNPMTLTMGGMDRMDEHTPAPAEPSPAARPTAPTPHHHHEAMQ